MASLFDVGSSGSSRLNGVVLNGLDFSAVTITTASINLVSILSTEAVQMGLVISDCVFPTNGTVPALLSADTDVTNVAFYGNVVKADSSGNYIEDNGGHTVSGDFSNSFFGPNSPPTSLPTT